MVFSESFLVGAVVKNLTANAGDARDKGSISGLGISPGEGNGNPCQYSCLENPMDSGAWKTTVHGIAESRTRLSARARKHVHTRYFSPVSAKLINIRSDGKTQTTSLQLLNINYVNKQGELHIQNFQRCELEIQKQKVLAVFTFIYRHLAGGQCGNGTKFLANRICRN